MNDYVRIRITGKNPRLFIKRLLRQNVDYKDFKEINHQKIEFTIDYKTYLEVKDKSSIYDIQIIRYYGPIRYFNFIKTNLTFFISFIISLFFLFLIGNMVFEIDIIHNDSNLRNLLKEQLGEYGIKKFKVVPDFNKINDVKEKILKNNKDKIEWLEIERTGSKLVVKVAERRINNKEEDLPKRHIVASKNGIILKIEAEDGVIVKKVNDYVTKGEIIVSGDIIKDDTVKNQVTAKGVVYAETWYNVNVEYPLYYEQTTYLDEVKNNIILNFLSTEFALKKNYEKSYLEKKKTLIKSKIFPFEISMEKQRKIKVTKEKLSVDEAMNKAKELAEKKLSSKLNDDEYIISKKTLNFYKKDSKIILDVFFKVCENITDYKNVDENLMENSNAQE